MSCLNDQLVCVYRGVDRTLQFTSTSGSISGATISFIVSDRLDSADVKFTKLSPDVNIITATQVNVRIEREDTLTLAEGLYRWTLRRIDTSNDDVIAAGDFDVLIGPGN